MTHIKKIGEFRSARINEDYKKPRRKTLSAMEKEMTKFIGDKRLTYIMTYEDDYSIYATEFTIWYDNNFEGLIVDMEGHKMTYAYLDETKEDKQLAASIYNIVMNNKPKSVEKVEEMRSAGINEDYKKPRRKSIRSMEKELIKLVGNKRMTYVLTYEDDYSIYSTEVKIWYNEKFEGIELEINGRNRFYAYMDEDREEKQLAASIYNAVVNNKPISVE